MPSQDFGSLPKSVWIFDRRALLTRQQIDPQLDPEILGYTHKHPQILCEPHKRQNHEPLQHITDVSFDLLITHCMVMYDIVEVKKIPQRDTFLNCQLLSESGLSNAWKKNRLLSL